MKGKKIRLILGMLSAKEMLDFSEFVQSPYFNKDPQLVSLTAYLQELHPDFSGPIFSLNKIPAELFETGIGSAKKVSYLLSNLQQLLEQFLVVQRLKSKAYLHEFMCINALRERNLRELYLNRLQRFQENLSQTDIYHREALTIRFMVSDIIADLADSRIEEMEESLQQAIDALFEFFLSNVLRYAYKSHNRQAIQFLNPPHIPLLQELEGLVQQYQERNPIIQLYYLLYACVREPEQDQYFDELRALLPQHQNELGERQLRIIYLATINISLRKMRSKPEKYTQTTLDLYTEGMDNRAWM